MQIRHDSGPLFELAKALGFEYWSLRKLERRMVRELRPITVWTVEHRQVVQGSLNSICWGRDGLKLSFKINGKTHKPTIEEMATEFPFGVYTTEKEAQRALTTK